ncbi:MAG: M48 family peptidase [Spirochaetaceae bacterium]|nr:MAG: M48 family peptidase [Spirochaetaceae bacterium]
MIHKPLPNISPRAWEHPADRAALTALKQVPGLDDVIRFFLGLTGEKSIRLLFLASAVRVGPAQFPRLDELLTEACRVLDVSDRPELYVTQNPMLNAGAVGVQKPFITLNSSMIDTLDDDETLAVIAHELAHILSGHVLYKTLLWFLLNAAAVFVRIPVAQLVLLGVLTALKEWDRKSELSADRAGLLVVQDPKVATTLLMKLAGGRHLEQMSVDAFTAQADEYDAGGDILDGVYKLLNLMNQSHPFPVLRVSAIRQWAESGDYERILAGEYAIRTRDEADLAGDFTAASDAYREELKASKDPLAQAMGDIGDSFESVRQEAEKFFTSVFGGGRKE